VGGLAGMNATSSWCVYTTAVLIAVAEPYRDLFRQLIPDSHALPGGVTASGYLALQDIDSEDLLLLLGICREFLPADQWDATRHPRGRAWPKWMHRPALVMQCQRRAVALVGDTVRFTSLAPYRVRISGAPSASSMPLEGSW
jgi:hypothetical protein